jgi:hypothetical protein
LKVLLVKSDMLLCSFSPASMRAYGYRAGILIFFLLAAILYCSSIPLHFDNHVLDTRPAPVASQRPSWWPSPAMLATRMALEGMAIISTIFRISAVISFRLVRVRLLELVHSGRSPYPQFQSCLLIKIVTVTYLLFLVTWLYPLLKNRANATLEKNLKQAESALPKVRLSPRRPRGISPT